MIKLFLLLIVLLIGINASTITIDVADEIDEMAVKMDVKTHSKELYDLVKVRQLLRSSMERVLENLIDAGTQTAKDEYSAIFLSLMVQLNQVNDDIARVTGHRRFKDVYL